MEESQRNAYTCLTCKGTIITIDREDGTTPAMLRCRATAGCRGEMWSHWYQHVPHGEPSFEWRKPTKKEYRKMSAGMKQHIDMGGLNIYPVSR